MLKKLALTSLAVLALAACGTDKPDPLPGKRVSVLSWQQTLKADTTNDVGAVTLPSPQPNTDWAQAGGNATHAMPPVAFGNGALKQRWRTNIGEGSSSETRLLTQPVLAANVIYTMDAAGFVQATNAGNGDKIWRINLTPKHEETEDAAISGGLAVAEGRLVVTDGFGMVHGLDPQTGKQMWQYKLDVPARAAATIDAGRVYVPTLASQLVALNVADGAKLWQHTGEPEKAGLLGSPSVAVDGSTVVVAYPSGEVFALRAENGQVGWSDNVVSVAGAAQGQTRIADVRGAPVVVNGVVYAAEASSRLIAVNQSSGDRLWQREFGSMVTPVVAGNALFIVNAQNELVALNASNGKVFWVQPLARFKDAKDHEGVVLWSAPVLAGGKLWLAGTHGKIIAADPVSGKILSTQNAQGGVQIAPIVAGGVMYLLSEDGVLAAYQAN